MQEDPVVRSARREAIVTMLIFCAALIYTSTYSLTQAYGREEPPTEFYLGFPAWVFWGVIVPWFVCVGVSWWFAYRFMSDEPLDRGLDDRHPGGGDDHAF